MNETSSAYARIAPAFQGYAILAEWTKGNNGMIVKVALRSHSDVHPFKPYRIGASGQRMHVAMYRHLQDGSRIDLGAWEAMLAWWSDDPRQGMKVHLRLDDGPDGAVQHPLDGMQKGDELYMACWLIDDEEEIIPPEKPKRRRKAWEELAHAQQAHTLCNDKDFMEWSLIQASMLEMEGTMSGSDAAIAVIRRKCGIVSRSEFSQDNEHGLEARRQWTALLADFRQWQGNTY